MKHFFRGHSKYGSADRKTITALCFAYFRAGIVYHHLGKEQAIRCGLFITAQSALPVMELLPDEWQATLTAPLEEKLALLQPVLSPEAFFKKLFPLSEKISAGIDFDALGRSLLRQPGLFVRLRPGREQEVLRILQESGGDYSQAGPHALQLPPATVMDNRIVPDRDLVVQDLSSQQVAELLPRFPSGFSPRVWDCCAASGGKSLLAADVYSALDITVSDVRKSILRQLDARFKTAGIEKYKRYEIDFSAARWQQAASFRPPGGGFDLVIADVPCSGSGTWARSPEQIPGCTAAQLEAYAQRQCAIVRSVLPFVRPGGHLLYVTCSVFECENEAQVQFIGDLGCTLVAQRIFQGSAQGADTLFGALFRV